jgi:hypothetical protein
MRDAGNGAARDFGKKLVLAGATIALSIAVAELFVRWFVPVRNVGISWTVYDADYSQRLKKNLSARRVAPEFGSRRTPWGSGDRRSRPCPPPSSCF